MTEDREVAERELRARRSAYSDNTTAIAAQLLRLPIDDPPHGHPTPTRAEFVRRMMAAGLLPSEIVGEMAASGRVGDLAWSHVRTLLDLLEPSELEVECWVVTFEDADAISMPLPIAYDPLDHQDYDPTNDPQDDQAEAALAGILEALQNDGWTCRSVRRVRDQAYADEDEPFVTAVYYSLVRETA